VDLKGRSALVTGGAGGLGAATVRHLVGIGMGVGGV
jgi:NAD(P)-dependent dehydrogenase (short-subunit alcohol dehydrogenase family)